MNSLTSGSVSINCHVGGVLHNLARFYPNLASVIDELIQNALDADASRIQLKVNLKTRFIAIRDNGKGISQIAFEKKVSQSIGRSIKSASDLGQFGIGFISPVGKCKKFEVTSCPSPKRKDYTAWTFKVDNRASDVKVGWEKRKDLHFAPDQSHARSGQNVWWRTEIAIHEFIKDKTLSDVTLAGITDSATSRFSGKMEKLGTKLRVDFIDRSGKEEISEVSAKNFSGNKLPEKSFIRESSGKVIVRMYLATRRGAGRINIRFGEADNPYRFPFTNFASSTAKDLLSKEVMGALKSGVFEGEILGEKVKLTPQRTCFVRDDALIDLCIAIEEWFEDQGREFLDEERRERQEERYQEVGIKALGRIEQLMKDSDGGADLRAALRKFTFGTAGEGHTKLGGPGQQKKKSKATGGSNKKKTSGNKPSSPLRKPPEKEQEDNPHLTSQGPKGSHRNRVRGKSFGLQFAYDELPDSPNLWELEQEEGIIVFNTMHPDWVALDKKGDSDWRLCSLMEIVTLHVLSLLSMPDESWRQHQRLYSDEVIKHSVSWLLFGGGMPLSRSAKKKK